MNSNLQVYGRNSDAQQIVKDQIDAAFPALEQQFDITGQILQKFYDWAFPFMYTEDGGATMTWTASVRSWITRNAKLSQLEELFENSGTDGTFTETYGGDDTETFTDNHATEQKTEFSGVNETLSGALADKVTNSPVSGQNTEERKTAYGRTRTYADGRNWTEVMNDITRAEEPVYTFINSFARLLVSPDWRKERFCDVLPPSVEMEVQTETLPSGSAATAEIENRGTPFNADWLLSLGIPTGAAGEPGPDGKAALTYDNLYFSSTVPPVTIIQEISKFNRTPEVGDMCLFPVYFTGSSPNTRPVYIVCGKCSAVDSAYATFTTVNWALIGGEKGEQGATGATGAPGNQGAAGADALMYTGGIVLNSVPQVGQSTTCSDSWFSRPPVVGDGFSAILTYNGFAYAVVMKVTDKAGEYSNCEFTQLAVLSTYVKYVHHATFAAASQGAGGTQYYIEVFGISDDAAAYTSLSDFINGVGNNLFFGQGWYYDYINNNYYPIVRVRSSSGIMALSTIIGTALSTLTFPITNSINFVDNVGQ